MQAKQPCVLWLSLQVSLHVHPSLRPVVELCRDCVAEHPSHRPAFQEVGRWWGRGQLCRIIAQHWQQQCISTWHGMPISNNSTVHPYHGTPSQTMVQLRFKVLSNSSMHSTAQQGTLQPGMECRCCDHPFTTHQCVA